MSDDGLWGCLVVILVGVIIFIVLALLTFFRPPPTSVVAYPWTFAPDCIEVRSSGVAEVKVGVYCLSEVGVK